MLLGEVFTIWDSLFTLGVYLIIIGIPLVLIVWLYKFFRKRSVNR